MLNKFSICLCFFAVSFCICFNIEELKSLSYEVDILQTPRDKEDDQTSLVVHMTSIFGQEYECLLPQVKEEEISEKVPFNEKDVDIKELLKPLHNGNCLVKAKDWWTYELCFGQYIKQFHIQDGQIIGQVLTLGRYDNDYDWNEENHQEKFKHSKQPYHSQFYVNGTKCDLTGQPRVTEVRIFCEEDSIDYIHRVDEPGTCSYVFTVHTSRVCSHPILKPLPSKKVQKIPCHPSLSEEQYSHYLEKLNNEKEQADLKRSQWLTNQQEHVQALKNENLLKSENVGPKEFEKQSKSLVVNDFSDDQSPASKIQSGKDLEKTKDSLSNNKLSVETLMEEDKNEKGFSEASQTPNNAFDHDSKTQAKSESKTKDKIAESGIKKKTKNEEEIKADDLPKNDNNNDLQVRIRTLDRMHSNGKINEIDDIQQKKLETAVKERLEKLGINADGRKIEVKIIKSGYLDTQLIDKGASRIENVITALLTGEQEAVQESERNKKLEESYKFTWEDENEDESD